MPESNVTPITAALGWAPLSFDGVKGFERMELLLEACRQLEAQGEAINRAHVSAASGVTNNNLVAAGIALYRKRQVALASAPATPASVVEVITRAVDRAFVQVRKETEALAAAEREAFREAMAAAEASEIELESRLEAAERAAETERQARMDAEERLRTREAELATERERARALESDYAQSQRDLAQAREAIELTRRDAEAARQRHDAQLADQRAEHAATRRELVEGHEREIALRLQEIDQLRTEAKQREKAAVEEGARQAGEIKRLNQALAGAESKTATQQKDIERLERAVETAQGRVEALTTEIAKGEAISGMQASVEQRYLALEALVRTLVERLPPPTTSRDA